MQIEDKERLRQESMKEATIVEEIIVALAQERVKE
jgi:hypothetical protein